MTSKKIETQIDAGLGLWTAINSDAVMVYRSVGDEITLAPFKGKTALKPQIFDTLELLETAMRKFQPDLRRWRTSFVKW